MFPINKLEVKLSFNISFVFESKWTRCHMLAKVWLASQHVRCVYTQTLFVSIIEKSYMLTPPSIRLCLFFEARYSNIKVFRWFDALTSSIQSTGWGRLIGGGSPATILQQAAMPVVDHQTCANANKNLATVDQESMVCAGYATAGNVISGCQGDSGGPFVCEENGRFVLHGAVSWGHPNCEAEKTYTVFASVSSHVDWIKHKMAIGG